MRYLGKSYILIIIIISFISCGSDSKTNGTSDDDCTPSISADAATFFEKGDYSFSCLDDNGPFTIMYPEGVNNHRISSQNENAVDYIIAANYLETQDKAIGNFLFANAFAESISETKISVSDLGAESYFYEIIEDTSTKHFLIFRACNFVGSISGEFPSNDVVPCNLGKNTLIAFAHEMMSNI